MNSAMLYPTLVLSAGPIRLSFPNLRGRTPLKKGTVNCNQTVTDYGNLYYRQPIGNQQCPIQRYLWQSHMTSHSYNLGVETPPPAKYALQTAAKPLRTVTIDSLQELSNTLFNGTLPTAFNFTPPNSIAAAILPSAK